MGRRENPLPRSGKPVVALAAHLRELRIKADLTYTGMAATVTAAASALSEAAAGRVLPRLGTVRDYVRACRGTAADLARAEHLWREAKHHAKGTRAAGTPDPTTVQTARQFTGALNALIEEAGFFGVRAIESATGEIGRRIPRNTMSQWLRRNDQVMSAAMLDTLLTVCEVDSRQRAEWEQARTRAALVVAGLRTPATFDAVSTPPVLTVVPPLDTGEPNRSALSLTAELKALCRGRGVQTPGLDRQVGPALREACGIDESDGADGVREKVRAWVSALVGGFPDDLRLAVTTPLALHDEAQHAFLAHRVQWLADRTGRDSRTTRRRVDEGLARLVEAAELGRSARSPKPPTVDDGWRTCAFEALLRLDGKSPTCTERRTIRADRDGVDRITWSMTLPPAAPDARPGNLDVRVLQGVELISSERRSSRRFVLHLRLPRALAAGQTHQFSLEVGIPNGQPMRPTYTFWPERACERFRLAIRFSHAEPPASVWRTEGAYPGDTDDVVESEDLLAVNDIGEVEVSFENLEEHRGYGVQWRPGNQDLPAPVPLRTAPLPSPGGARAVSGG
ncbi:MAG TPA: hypothetical protein VNO31_43470 [Umezawaea sp.]|nr:hypothetical protein [Umezawaea sp.]